MDSVDYVYFNYKTEYHRYYAEYTSADPVSVTSAPLRRAVDIRNYYFTESELMNGKLRGGSVIKFFGPESVWLKSGIVNEEWIGRLKAKLLNSVI